MELDVVEKTDNLLRFIIRGSNNTFVNALRRIMIAEVPTLAIEDIILVENSSPVLDEMIAHRLGLIPLTTPVDEFTVSSECDNCNGEGCQFCSVALTLEIEADGNETLVVYSGELRSVDPKVVPVSDKIPIAKLAPGQKIVLEAVAMMGRGKSHAKWSPVSNASHRYYPRVNQDPSKCVACMDCIEACPEALLELKDKIVELKEPLACVLCDLCTIACTYDSLKMEGIPGDYIFTVESTGALPPLAIIKKATEILKNKSKEFEVEYKKALDIYQKTKK